MIKYGARNNKASFIKNSEQIRKLVCEMTMVAHHNESNRGRRRRKKTTKREENEKQTMTHNINRQ